MTPVKSMNFLTAIKDVPLANLVPYISNVLASQSLLAETVPQLSQAKPQDLLKLNEYLPTEGASVEELVETGNPLVEGTGKVVNLWEKSLCSKDELYKYLKNIDENVADLFKTDEIWPSGIQIPKNSSVLNADGTINWGKAPKGGYTLDAQEEAIKKVFVPEVGEVIDRYGNTNGRYASPIIDGNSYSYTQRSLPYVEDLTSYHQYKVVGDFSKIEEYVRNCSDLKVKAQIEATVKKYYKGDYSRLVSYKGKSAAVEGWGTGGAIQYEFSLIVEQLVCLKLLKEI